MREAVPEVVRYMSASSPLGTPAAGLGRPLSSLPCEAMGLWNPANERDSCGVGMVVHLKSKVSRDIVVDANQMLVRMSHRGGCGCDPTDGDGAGMLVGIPDSFLRDHCLHELKLVLPPPGKYGVGNVFVSKNPGLQQAARIVVEKAAKSRGLKVIGWRTLPVDNSSLGANALQTEPLTEQCYEANERGYGNKELERELYMTQVLASNEANDPKGKFYVYSCSLSSQTVIYKGSSQERGNSPPRR